MKQPLDSDEVRIVIASPPEQVYELVADVTRMPEFSPELVDCRWLGGATGPVVGARFQARNKAARGPSWGNKPVITAVEPGRVISWARSEPLAGTVEWSYRFEPHEGGTEVTERYDVTAPISRLGWLVITTMSPGDRRAQMRDGMEETLRRIKARAEAAPSGP
jgi:uncharacterized protein YndB with AHSA1/START domain